MSLIYRKDIEKLHGVSLTDEEKQLFSKCHIFNLRTVGRIQMGCLHEKYKGGDGVSDVQLTYNQHGVCVTLSERDLITDQIIKTVDSVFIPYRNVKSISSDKETISWIQPASVEYKNRSALKGAVIGGVVAGAPGAVVGAAISANTPKKVVKLESAHSSDIHSFKIEFTNGVKLEVDDLMNLTSSQRHLGLAFASQAREIAQYKENSFDIRTPDGLSKAEQIRDRIESFDKEISNLEAEQKEKQALYEQYALSIFGEKARIKREAKSRLEEIRRELPKLKEDKASLQ